MLSKHIPKLLLIRLFRILALFPAGFCQHITLLASLSDFYIWLDNIGHRAAYVFVFLDILVVVFLLPGLILSIGAGLLFGFTKGVALVTLGTTLGALISFNIARYFLSESVGDYLKNHPKLDLVNEEFIGEGWRFILLTRLVPFFPFKLSNYYYGFANFSQKDFLIGTLLGIIPITCINVYFGAIASDIRDFLLYGEHDFTYYWWLWLAGILITIFTVCYIRAHIRQALLRSQKGSFDMLSPG